MANSLHSKACRNELIKLRVNLPFVSKSGVAVCEVKLALAVKTKQAKNLLGFFMPVVRFSSVMNQAIKKMHKPLMTPTFYCHVMF